MNWISHTCPQGYPDLRSPAKCLDHRCCGSMWCGRKTLSYLEELFSSKFEDGGQLILAEGALVIVIIIVMINTAFQLMVREAAEGALLTLKSSSAPNLRMDASSSLPKSCLTPSVAARGPRMVRPLVSMRWMTRWSSTIFCLARFRMSSSTLPLVRNLHTESKR